MGSCCCLAQNISASSQDGSALDIHENHDFQDLWTDLWPCYGSCTYLETSAQSERDISFFLPFYRAVIQTVAVDIDYLCIGGSRDFHNYYLWPFLVLSSSHLHFEAGDTFVSNIH